MAEKIVEQKRGKCPNCKKVYLWDWGNEGGYFAKEGEPVIKQDINPPKGKISYSEITMYSCPCGYVLGFYGISTEGEGIPYDNPYWKDIDWESQYEE